MRRETTEDILRRYGAKISQQINEERETGDVSRDYLRFKREMMPNLSRYERFCKSLGNIIKINISRKDREKIGKELRTAHLSVTPSQVLTFSLVTVLLTFFVGVLLSLVIFFWSGEFPFLFLFLVLIASLFVFYYTYNLPAQLANQWKLKASSQMVPCILYVVVYMKHTSNLERAIAFASKHLQYPLALDFRKIFWDVETGRFSSIKESLDHYLLTWEHDAPEFVESFHLIESSLFESSEARRIAILEKALEVMLDGVYDKMLTYSREIRAPLTNVYMLGIVLPTLALALIPLASTLLKGAIQWYHIFVIFNLIIPFFVYYLTSQIMLKRPGGYGESDLLELNPLYPKYKSKQPYVIAALICIPLLLIGFLPFLFQIDGLTTALGVSSDFTFAEIGFLGDLFGDLSFFDFKEYNGETIGPFGPIALLLSLCIPLSIAMFFAISYNMKTKEIIESRVKTKKLEKEFTNSLFMLGNRLGDGLPAEVAFGKVAHTTKGQMTKNFFNTVSMNIQQAGMSLEQAIFNPHRGAIIYYPSSLIATSMRILIESVKKGIKIAAESLMSISDYVKNIHKIEDRLRDLLAEVVSDMKSNMTFLAPLLAGVVAGLAGMITIIINKLYTVLQSVGNLEQSTIVNLETALELISIFEMIPPYYLQIAIGLYIVEIVFILTSALVTVDAGEDKLKKKHDTGRNLRAGITLYLIVAFIATVALSVLAMVALKGLAT